MPEITPRMRLWIAVWLTVLVVLVVVAILADLNTTLEAGVLGAWCGIAIAAAMVVWERSKKQPPNKLARERYGKR
jgi:TRAP-type mannitol/chloroaromatic compound transport system permease large subunit